MNPETQDNFPKPKVTRQENSGMGVRVEARPAKDILEDPYAELEREQCEWYEENYQSGYEETEKEVLPYIPFDAGKALKELRKLSPEEQVLPVIERREIIKQRLAELKENLRQQSLGVSSIIRNLRVAVEAKPDSTAEELLASVKEKAPQFRLSENQLNTFRIALDDYEKKHKMVEKYRAMYPRDEDLFEACFGRKPVGEIIVIKRPMILHFQCMSLDDYAVAYNFSEIKEDANEITDEDRGKADLSGGAALSTVKIEELHGTVTIENVPRNLKYEVVREKKTAEIKRAILELGIDAQKSDVEIEAKGQGRWRIKFLEKDAWQFPKRIQLFDLNSPDAVPIFDVVRVKPDYKNTPSFGALKNTAQPEVNHFDITCELKIRQNGKELFPGRVNVNYDYIKIADYSEGTVVKYQEDVALPPRPYGKNDTNPVLIHEEQHQFNKLFVPFEIGFGRYRVILDIAERAKNPVEAKEIIVGVLVREYRQFLMDRRARDEVIAYYHDGTSAKDIFSILTQNPLYDYIEKSKEEIDKLPERIVKKMEDEMSEVLYNREPDDGGGYFESGVVDAIPLSVDEAMVKRQIEKIFRGEYKRDLQMWLDAINLLERKKYNRDEIISILAQEPVRNWNAVSRRLGEKN